MGFHWRAGALGTVFGLSAAVLPGPVSQALNTGLSIGVSSAHPRWAERHGFSPFGTGGYDPGAPSLSGRYPVGPGAYNSFSSGLGGSNAGMNWSGGSLRDMFMPRAYGTSLIHDGPLNGRGPSLAIHDGPIGGRGPTMVDLPPMRFDFGFNNRG